MGNPEGPVELIWGSQNFLSVSEILTPTRLISILMTGNAELKVIGELKAHWVREHRFRKAYEEESPLRHLLAQPLKYMRDLKCKYGFLSNYEETIFLRQEFIEGRWTVDYSPVIWASTSYVKSDLAIFLGTPSCPLRQCFLAIVVLAQAQGLYATKDQGLNGLCK